MGGILQTLYDYYPIEIWGTYPPPIGWVSIHIYRLIHSLQELDNSIILKNFGKNRVKKYNYIINVQFHFYLTKLC
jgi:hypothetical protein